MLDLDGHALAVVALQRPPPPVLVHADPLVGLVRHVHAHVPPLGPFGRRLAVAHHAEELEGDGPRREPSLASLCGAHEVGRVLVVGHGAGEERRRPRPLVVSVPGDGKLVAPLALAPHIVALRALPLEARAVGGGRQLRARAHTHPLIVLELEHEEGVVGGQPQQLRDLLQTEAPMPKSVQHQSLARAESARVRGEEMLRGGRIGRRSPQRTEGAPSACASSATDFSSAGDVVGVRRRRAGANRLLRGTRGIWFPTESR